MIWLQITLAVVGLGRELIKYLREKENCEKKQMPEKIKALGLHVKNAKLNGSSALLDDALWLHDKNTE